MRCKACNKIMTQGEYQWMPEIAEFTDLCKKCKAAVAKWSADDPLQDEYVKHLVDSARALEREKDDA